jgi:hypothetical protein
MPQLNLAPLRQPTTHFFTGDKSLTNGLKCCFLSPARDENHVCNNDVEAHVAGWLHRRLAARLPSIGHRGNEILTGQTIFQKTRDCQSIAGFLLI